MRQGEQFQTSCFLKKLYSGQKQVACNLASTYFDKHQHGIQ